MRGGGRRWGCWARGLAICAGWVALAGQVAMAEDSTPTGLWRIIDDVTGKPQALMRIIANGDHYSGRIEKFLDPDADPDQRCHRCNDARKDQPVLGMVILQAIRKIGERYSQGEILDPDSGWTYKVRLTPLVDSAQVTGNVASKLEVHGYIGVPLLGRTQVWQRAE